MVWVGYHNDVLLRSTSRYPTLRLGSSWMLVRVVSLKDSALGLTPWSASVMSVAQEVSTILDLHWLSLVLMYMGPIVWRFFGFLRFLLVNCLIEELPESSDRHSFPLNTSQYALRYLSFDMPYISGLRHELRVPNHWANGKKFST